MPQIIHYRNRCIGCAVCYELQPEYWRMSRRDGKATLIGGEKKKNVYIRIIPERSVREARKIADACPLGIIQVQ